MFPKIKILLNLIHNVLKEALKINLVNIRYFMNIDIFPS